MGYHSNMIAVNGQWIKSPSAMTVHIEDVSAANAGRTEDALMQKQRIARKVKIDLTWAMPTPSEAHQILSAFSPEYFNVTFFYPLYGGYTTKSFYSGEQSAPVKVWMVNNKRYESIQLSIIER